MYENGTIVSRAIENSFATYIHIYIKHGFFIGEAS